eukprot:2070001-Karenia_brevis.AAC.1
MESISGRWSTSSLLRMRLQCIMGEFVGRASPIAPATSFVHIKISAAAKLAIVVVIKVVDSIIR